ncbi:MAG TPA: hypothetical protein VMW27_12220 [Thermoanaerobaculia bacterium]|nr:hypothetical protein [Thermoanaerobaculia bacterium]
MKRTLAFLSALVFCFMPAAEAAKSPPATLAEVNERLKGRVASLELADGRTIERARDVSVAADFTSWRDDGEPQRVPTSDLVRITSRKQRRILKGLGVGLAAGVGAGLLAIGTSSDSGNDYVDASADASVLAGAIVVGGIVGAVVGAARGRGGAGIVYEGPVERYLEAPNQGASANSRDSQSIGLAARNAPEDVWAQSLRAPLNRCTIRIRGERCRFPED